MSSASGYGPTPRVEADKGGIAAPSAEAEYSLTDPKSLAEYLSHANIRLVRAEYLHELLKSRRTLPRRQEAEEWGLVTHAEVRAWAAGTRDAMICSVSHAWESREHPDPCGHQLKCLVDVVSLVDAAYFSDVWLFYDYVSLFQFKRESDAEEESFRRSMQDMHVLYAHECTRTFRIENLTPDDVWEAASKNSKYRVRVYDARSAVVRDRPLKELVANRVPYGTRGWCKAEVEWSSTRSHSEQNHWIDAPESQDRNKELWVSECEEAIFENLPEGQLGQPAKALPYLKKLRMLRLRDFKVGRAEAREFAKALASNQTIRELEIRLSPYGHGCGFLWEAICEALKYNSTLTSINLASRHRRGGWQGNWRSINLQSNRIGLEGGKARWCQGLAQAAGSGGSTGSPAVATAVLPFPCEAPAEALNSKKQFAKLCSAETRSPPTPSRPGRFAGLVRSFRSLVLHRPLPGEGPAGSRREGDSDGALARLYYKV